MKERIFRILAGAALAAAVFATVSCTKDKGSDDGKTGPAEPVGTFVFNGETRTLYTAAYSAEDSYTMFYFSCEAPDDEKETYFVFGVHSDWADGQEHSMDNMSRGYDYVFRYSDLDREYSEYNALLEGSFFCITSLGDDTFIVQASLIMPDGLNLYINYLGKMISDRVF